MLRLLFDRDMSPSLRYESSVQEESPRGFMSGCSLVFRIFLVIRMCIHPVVFFPRCCSPWWSGWETVLLHDMQPVYHTSYLAMSAPRPSYPHPRLPMACPSCALLNQPRHRILDLLITKSCVINLGQSGRLFLIRRHVVFIRTF